MLLPRVCMPWYILSIPRRPLLPYAKHTAKEDRGSLYLAESAFHSPAPHPVEGSATPLYGDVRAAC